MVVRQAASSAIPHQAAPALHHTSAITQMNMTALLHTPQSPHTQRANANTEHSYWDNKLCVTEELKERQREIKKWG